MGGQPLDVDEAFAFRNRSSSIRISYGSPSTRRSKEKQMRLSASLSSSLRWATNVSALLSSLLFSGIIYGWAPLKHMLVQEGQYEELCQDKNNGCVLQADQFNKIFTMAQFLLSFASLPVGFCLDYSSKSVHYIVGAMVQVTGLFLFGISNSKTADYFVLGYSLQALGGCMTLLGAFPASFLLPKHQAGILAAGSCLFDASSIVFALFYRLYLINDRVFSRRDLFFIYGGVAVVIYLCLVLAWYSLEALDWKTVVKDEAKDSEDPSNKAQQEYGKESTTDSHLNRVVRLGMHDKSLLQQLLTFDFFLALTFASVHMLRCNFYIETVNELLFSYGDKDAMYANLFSFVLPAGIVFVPMIESTIRNLGVVRTLEATNGLGVLFEALLLIPSLRVQAFNFVIFACFRAYLYATLNTFVALTFGVSTMGRVIGCIFTTAAVVTLLQYPAAAVAERKGDFKVINSAMLALCLLPIVLVVIYQKRTRDANAVGEEQPLMGAPRA